MTDTVFDRFTNQVRRVATAADCKGHWSGGKNGRRFRCDLCGHRLVVGDGWRWVYGSGRTFDNNGTKNGVTNILVCDDCDGPDVLDRWVDRNKEFYSDKFWSLRDDD